MKIFFDNLGMSNSILSSSPHRTKILEMLQCCHEANDAFKRAFHWAIAAYRNLNQGDQVRCYKQSSNWYELYKHFCILLLNCFGLFLLHKKHFFKQKTRSSTASFHFLHHGTTEITERAWVLIFKDPLIKGTATVPLGGSGYAFPIITFFPLLLFQLIYPLRWLLKQI